MTTKIFNSHKEFREREDKTINGVSPDFARLHKDYEEQNKTNSGCWNCIDCLDCHDCIDCHGCKDCRHCRHCSDCHGCSDCSYCSDCHGCSYCSDCSYCKYCSYCSDCHGCSYCSDFHEGEENKTPIPKIKNIHQLVFESTYSEFSLEMDEWHACETTHCRAGWVVHLAGEEGYELEEKTNTLFAAMQIYRKSSDIKVSPCRFFESNESAIEDIKRCAELEKESGSE